MRLVPSLALAGACVCLLFSSSCRGRPTSLEQQLPQPQERFWKSICELKGRAFMGSLLEQIPPDERFSGKELMLHVRTCENKQIQLVFQVGRDRSRSWIFRQAEGRLSLQHVHRRPDGTEETLSGYGGYCREAGSEDEQRFLPDRRTIDLLPQARSNVWSVKVVSGKELTYRLQREGGERRFAVRFDLKREMPMEGPGT